MRYLRFLSQMPHQVHFADLPSSSSLRTADGRGAHRVLETFTPPTQGLCQQISLHNFS